MPKVFIPANGNVSAIATPAITLSRTRAPGTYPIAGANGNPDMPTTVITLSCSDPQAGNTAPVLGDYTCAYSQPGDYVVRLTANDATTGFNYTTTRRVKIENPLEKIAVVLGVYNDMIDRLKASDKTSALNLFFEHARDQYDDVFTKLDTDLVAATSQLGVIARVSVHSDSAEASLMRTVSGVTKIFSILLLRGEDCIWRIEAMWWTRHREVMNSAGVQTRKDERWI